MDPVTDPDMVTRPRTWVVPALALAWVAIHAYALHVAGWWKPPGAPWWAFGSPGDEVLTALGGLVPARVKLGEWPRALTYTFLHASLLDLLLDLWIGLWAGRTLERIAGGARTWIVFAVATATGAAMEVLLAEGSAVRMVHVGAFSGIVGWIGSLGVWSFSTSTPPAPALRRTVIMFLIVVGALSVLLGGSLWGPLGGLVGGVLAMLLLGPRRVHLRPGLATLLTAIALFGGIAVAAASQLTATDTLERERLAPLFEELTAVERLADRLYERPDHARPEERAELSRRLDALLAADTLEGLEGHHELEAYLDTLRPVATGDIPDPLAFEHRRRQARGAWRPHEKRLRAASGATRSFN